ncbi:DUF357 domain-containing protein [archaeon]|nr:DUF357 domain-containing protein [archaeon]
MQTLQIRFKQYFTLTKTALKSAKESRNISSIKNKVQLRKEFIEMIECYAKDAEHFFRQGDYANAFACINYAHGWLDAGARIKLFDVHDSKLFAVE